MTATKTTSSEKPSATDVVEAPASFKLTLDEYCARRSQTDRRVELIGAFHHSEKVAGRVKDDEAAFDARLDEFANKPA